MTRVVISAMLGKCWLNQNILGMCVTLEDNLKSKSKQKHDTTALEFLPAANRACLSLHNKFWNMLTFDLVTNNKRNQS
jgi:hypothetical protein